MTKRITILALMLSCLSSHSGLAQKAFEKNNFIVSAGFGVGFGYGYQNYTTDNFYTSYNYSYDFRVNYTVGTVFPVTAEYALSNKFGIGLAYQHGSYINIYSDKSTSNSIGAFGAFHFVSKRKLELYTRLIVGYSMLDYTEQPSNYDYYDPTGSYIPTTNNTFNFKPKGAYAKPSFGMRLYFTEHFGMFADIGIGVYSYKTNKVETDQGTYDLNKRFHYLVINGELTTGLVVKF